LAKSKLEKPKRLQQQAHREWQEIKHGSLKFQRRQQEADAIRSLQKSDLLAFFKVSFACSQKKNIKVTPVADHDGSLCVNSGCLGYEP